MCKKLLFLSCILAVIFLLGCQQGPAGEVVVVQPEPVVEEPEPTIQVQVGTPDPEPEPEPEVCTRNSDCVEGLLCIDGGCGTIADFYNTDCAETCKMTEVLVSTSDGDDYTLKLGQGSYSFAGALEWKLMSTPAYCKGDAPLVPVRIIKKSGGKILEEEVITLNKGATSDVITHPTIKRVQFTATVDDVTEDCSS